VIDKAAYNHAYYRANRERLIAYQKGLYERDKDRIKAQRAAYKQANRDLLRARGRARYQKHRVVILEKQRQKRLTGEERAAVHGLTVDQYQAMVKEQGGLCAICGGAMKRICIDHDHETGAVRGLLCHNCNVALGHLRDSPALLRAAADYVESFVNKRVPKEKAAA
jgi:hypothetical protein